MKELTNYSEKLTKKKILVGFSKADLAGKETIKKAESFTNNKIEDKPLIFSSVSKFRLDILLDNLWNAIISESN